MWKEKAIMGDNGEFEILVLSVSGIALIYMCAHQKSAQRVNFCSSVGVAKYSPWPLLLKQKVLEILGRVAAHRKD